MKRKILCGLDIGNSKLTAVLARSDRQNVQILSNETVATRGLCKGVVKDLASLSDCIQEALGKICKKSGMKIKRVLVSVNGDYISGRYSFAAFALSDRANRHISLTDVNYLRRQAQLLGAHIDEALLHEFPQDYILDGKHTTLNPVGLLARNIQLNSFILNASQALLGNIKTAVVQAGYETDSVIYSGVASSFSILSEEEMRRGVILIDLGACFTGLLFFKDTILRDFKIISFGGGDITDDISAGLGIPWELAEDIKKTSLILTAAESKHSEMVVVRKGSSYKTIERRLIYESAKTRLEEFLNKIKNSIESSAWKDRMECGIVGVGGAANLEGILERLETQTGMQVRLGRISNESLIKDAASVEYAAAVGLINYASDYSNFINLKNYFVGKNTLGKTVNFLRNLYQEYF